MQTCQIKWIDDNGQSTADTNPAIGFARTKDHVQQLHGRGIHFPASQWFAICACHAERLNDAGMHIWEFKTEQDETGN
jgi:hypothetical protein